MGGKLLFLLKWIVIPAALGATGYYFLGPQLGQKVFPAKAPASADETAAPGDTVEGTAPATSFPSPSVVIDARTMTSTEGEVPKPKKKKKRRHKPTTPKPATTEDPPADAPPAQETPPPTQETPPPG